MSNEGLPSLFTASEDSTVRKWDLDAGGVTVYVYKDHEGPITRLSD